MRENANKRRQTLTNASKRRGENASKRGGENASNFKQTLANVDKRKQTLTPPFIVVFFTPAFAIPLIFPASGRLYFQGEFSSFSVNLGFFIELRRGCSQSEFHVTISFLSLKNVV